MKSVQPIEQPTPPLWGEWLRAKAASEYCGLSETYLYNMASAEAIPTYHAGTALLFKRTDLDEYIMRSRKAAV